jgi:Tol biopolymer transport system component
MVTPASVFASSLQFDPEPYEFDVFSTRVHLVWTMQTGAVEAGWQAEYAPAAAGCPPSCEWVETGRGKTEEIGGKFTPSVAAFLGSAPTPSQTPLALLHHLSPKTNYYARFRGTNSKSEDAEITLPFTTKPVAKPEITEFDVNPSSPTSAVATADVESNGEQSEYHFEYSPEGSEAWVPFTSGTSGTVTVAEDFATPEAKITGLAPETAYCARVTATNSLGTVVQQKSHGGGNGCFTTPSAKPEVGTPEVRNVTGIAARLQSGLSLRGSETHWRFEYATAESGPWTVVPGGEGVFSQTQAESFPEGAGPKVEASLAGLNPNTPYFVRVVARNAAGESTSPVSGFRTFGAPLPSTFAVHGLHGEALRLMGAVNPDSVPTSGEQTIALEGTPTGGTFTLTFKEHTTRPIPYDASGDTVLLALDELPGVQIGVGGPPGGPWRVYFTGADAGAAQPAITGDGSGLKPPGSVNVTVALAGGEGYDSHSHFEYVSERQFDAAGEEGGFAKATSTPEMDLGSGDTEDYVGADLPTLEPGETYHFRVVATNTSPGNPVVHGDEQVLIAPAAATGVPEVTGGCPNEPLRGGLSANLPDCRAYEQLTPIDKEASQEIFNYGGNLNNEGALPGMSGDHLEYGSVSVKWGPGPRAGQGPYFFTRTERTGWQITAGTVQPEAGIDHYTPQMFNPELTEFAFAAGWHTPSPSPTKEFRVGAPGGPYTTVTSVPTAKAEPGWVGASGDFSKLVLQVEDHSLLGHSTHTLEGDDLYEYSRGELRQVNVTSAGVTIGTCGARIAAAGFSEGSGFTGSHAVDAAHAVSGDGSRVFFEAAPGSGCSGPTHVYARVNGGGEAARTEDLGVYRFVAASADGGSVLLEKQAGENPGLYMYDSETGGAPHLLPSSGVAVGAEVTVSEDLSTVYIYPDQGEVGERDLYRYDINAGRLLFVSHIWVDNERRFFQSSPDGRYLYFIAATVAGLPAGGLELETPGASHHGHTSQVFRYDSAGSVLSCMSCASAYDSEPRLSALFAEGNANGSPTIASANGDYVFFDTPAALLPADVDGQVAPEATKAAGGEHLSSFYSLSSDVYEWRREGVGGCSRMQGCLALITAGGGGYLNILVGTTASGRDVFFATNESLVKSDQDTASDIYDARVNGGFAEPPRPVECAGDACAPPFTPPGEAFPASATFQGAGNLLTPALVAPPFKAKPKGKVRCKAKARSRAKTKCSRPRKSAHGKAKRAARHASATRETRR